MLVASKFANFSNVFFPRFFATISSVTNNFLLISLNYVLISWKCDCNLFRDNFSGRNIILCSDKKRRKTTQSGSETGCDAFLRFVIIVQTGNCWKYFGKVSTLWRLNFSMTSFLLFKLLIRDYYAVVILYVICHNFI